MPEPVKDVTTQVRRVWELLIEDGTVYTSNEDPTADAAVAKAQADLAKSIATQEDFEARYGGGHDFPDYHDIRFVKVRQRTSVTMSVYTTEYSEEQAIEEVDARA